LIETKINKSPNVLLLGNNLEEFLVFHQVNNDGGGVQVVLFGALGRELVAEVIHDMLLLGLDLLSKFIRAVVVRKTHQFVQNFGDRFLINMIKKVVHNRGVL